jgi:hypothetical protein
MADGISFAFASAIASEFAFSIWLNRFYEEFSMLSQSSSRFEVLAKHANEPARPEI